ncbi:MAG: DsrE family protein [Deltaproteobacteria bacterium]|nr:DsrE family protein [Deltaproteobacteria bacterium]MCL5276439.1 DsrE family protein [Deltaproteobacteria bacterium]
MRLCVLVAVSGKTILTTLRRLYDDCGGDIEFFLYGDGVLLLDDQSFMELSKHVKTTLCGVSGEERGTGKRDGVVFGSLYDLSVMAARSDRLVSFAREP